MLLVCAEIPVLLAPVLMAQSKTVEEGLAPGVQFRFLSSPLPPQVLFLRVSAPATWSFPFLNLSLCKLACTYHSFPGLKRQGKATVLSLTNLSQGVDAAARKGAACTSVSPACQAGSRHSQVLPTQVLGLNPDLGGEMGPCWPGPG